MPFSYTPRDPIDAEPPAAGHNSAALEQSQLDDLVFSFRRIRSPRLRQLAVTAVRAIEAADPEDT